MKVNGQPLPPGVSHYDGLFKLAAQLAANFWRVQNTAAHPLTSRTCPSASLKISRSFKGSSRTFAGQRHDETI